MYLKNASTKTSASCLGGSANKTSSIDPPMLQKLRKGYDSGSLLGMLLPLPLPLPLSLPSIEPHEFPSTKLKLRGILGLLLVVNGDSAIGTTCWTCSEDAIVWLLSCGVTLEAAELSRHLCRRALLFASVPLSPSGESMLSPLT